MTEFVVTQRAGKRWQAGRFTSSLLLACFLLVMVTPQANAFLVGLGYQYLRLLETGKAIHHDLRISLNPALYTAHFTDELTFRATKNTRELYIQLGVDYAIDSVTTTGGEPLSFRAHLRLGALPFTVYRIDLDERIVKDETATVRIAYHISPDTAQYSFPYVAQDVFYTTIPMLWYPQMPTEGYFDATVHLDAPENLTMIGEGEPVAGTDGRSWTTVKPVPGFGVVIGNFESQHERLGERDVFAWHVAGDPGRAALVANRTAQAAQFFEDVLGPLPLQRMDVVGLPYGMGGSIAQYSLLIYDELMSEIPLDNEVMLAYLAAHEAAHKWFGFVAGWRVLGTPWMSEGLADYLAFLAVEAMYGPQAMREVIETRAIRPMSEYDGRMRSLASIELMDDDVTVAYQKGSLVFRTLHRRLGDEGFFDLLRTFLKDYELDHATARDFTNLIERVGDQTVKGFVSNWVNGALHLDYALRDVQVVPEKTGERLSFKVESVGRLIEPGPVEIVIHLADGRDEWVTASLGETISVAFDQPVAQVTVDPNYWTPDWQRDNNVWEAVQEGRAH